MNSKVMLLEFNEINSDLILNFIEQGKLPNFKALYEQSSIYNTDAKTNDAGELEPWVQWVTVHSGLNHDEHGIRKLGKGKNLDSKMIAEVLSDQGINVGIFSSMNTNYDQVNGYIIPDPWDTKGEAFPKNLQTFYSFVKGMVQEHSTNGRGSLLDVIKFGMFMLTHGLSYSTIKLILKQLLSELKADLSWKRGAVLDSIQYDVFKWLTHKYSPRFTTLFSNSVAHYQHYFWRNMSPELFDEKPDSNIENQLESAILYGYQVQDKILGRIMKDFPDYTLMLCSALTQEPWLDAKKVTYRPTNFSKFLQFIDVDPKKVSIKPVMAEQFYIDCSDIETAEKVEKMLTGLKINQKNAMMVKREGLNIFTGCIYNDEGINNLSIENDLLQSSVNFKEYFNLVSSKRSGKHNPKGLLWIKNDHHQVVDEPLDLTSISPSIIKFLGAEPTKEMKASVFNIR